MEKLKHLNPGLNCDKLEFGSTICVEGHDKKPEPTPEPTPKEIPEKILHKDCKDFHRV